MLLLRATAPIFYRTVELKMLSNLFLKMLSIFSVATFFLICFSTTTPSCATVAVAQEIPLPQIVSVTEYEPQQFRDSLFQTELLFARAIQHEANGCEQCVDYYFQAATSAWAVSQSQLANTGQILGRAGQIYRESLQKLIVTGQQYRRLNPRNGLQVFVDGGSQFVPVVHQGFVRETNEFDCLMPMESTGTKKLENIYRCEGLGVSIVVQHCGTAAERFRRDQQSFAATAVLRPAGFASGLSGHYVLELLDPLRVNSIDELGRRVAIVRDISAPIVYLLENQQTKPIEAFLHPGGTRTKSKLFMIEPYQPEKIPLVFVHGLLSDPLTWANIANELMARPELLKRYQLWGFEYATGAPFLVSAADMRDQLGQAQAALNPNGIDVAFSQMVLVGHSMGGLISKLQITESGDQLWQSVSICPLNMIATSDDTRNRLARAFYFGPSDSVAKVIYMGTPHRGSPWARRPVGLIGAMLVEEPSSTEAQHRNLVFNNPGVFSREFEKRVPTSIDLLRPDSQLLLAIDRLYVANGVQEHSIIGTFRPMLIAGKSDGVVPVSSAMRPGAQSEILVRAKHTDIPDKQESVEELVRILWQHACQN